MHHANRIIDLLTTELGADSVLVGEAARERQTTDWSGANAVAPLAIILPRSPQQVARTLNICSTHQAAISIQGGLTGLAGGANPQAGEMVLSLARLNTIEDIDAVGGTVVAQAGVTLEALQTAVAEKGWFFPLDLGARGSCQIGGNAATNAGGNRVLRYGMMRDSVLGLEVALADGTLLTMLDRVIKNNAGFDLKHLFIGSEGSLGVITRLSLKLVPENRTSSTVLCAVPDFAAATQLLRQARQKLPELSSFELMWDDFFQASARVIHKPSPFAEVHPLYVLIETLGNDEPAGTQALEQFLEQVIESGLVADAVMAQSVQQAENLWAFREVSELLPSVKPYAAFDVSVAMPDMDSFVATVRAQLATHYPQQQHLFFGHLGDGNLHLISGPMASDQELEAVEALVYEAIGRVGGSISAEHGIGVVKRPFLHHSRDEAQIRLMRQLKGLLDPHQILNPGRVVAGRDRT